MKGKIRESLRFSFLDGVCAAATAGLLDNFLVPMAIALHATASQIAGLASLPGLVSAFAQLQAGPLRNLVGSRKTIMVGGVLMQVVCIFALAGVPWIAPAGQVPMILALQVLFVVMGGLATPMWGSLMCEYLPASRRSGYFGWRNRMMGGVTILATLGGGALLQHFGKGRLTGFMWVILAAASLRALSLRFLNGLYEPPAPGEGAVEEVSYRSCLSGSGNFRRFILASGLMNFGVNISAPFMAMHMLRDLRFSYGLYTAMVLGSQLPMYWMMARWGRSADRAGNMKIIQVSARLIPFTAPLWVFSGNPVFLFLVQVLSGASWAGYNLCLGNFVYDSVPNRQRVHATTLFNTVNGLACFGGAALGGWLMERLPAWGGHPFYGVLAVSFAARFVVGWALFPRLREVRQVPKTRSLDVVYDVVRMETVPPFTWIASRLSRLLPGA